MSLLFLDGGDHLADAALAAKWDSVRNVRQYPGQGRFGTAAYGAISSARPAPTPMPGALTKNLSPRTPTEGIIGFSLYTGTPTYALGPYIPTVQLIGAPGTEASLGFAPDGSLAVYRGPTIIAYTPTAIAQPNVWLHLELRFVLSATAGAVEVRLNGQIALLLAPVDTAAATWTGFLIRPIATERLDDIWALDLADPPATFLGPNKRIYTLYPTADGTEHDWPPASGGAAYAAVNESVANADLTYQATAVNRSKTSVKVDLDLALRATRGKAADEDLTGIEAVQLNGTVRRVSSGPPIAVQQVFRSPVGDVPGAVNAVSLPYAVDRHVWSRLPTGEPLAHADLIAGEYVMERISSAAPSGGGGNVTGPGLATPNDIALFNDPTGTSIKDSGYTIASLIAAAAAEAGLNPPGAHHATHEFGGSDALVGAAWLARQNQFTGSGRSIEIVTPTPQIQFYETGAPVDARRWRQYASAQQLQIDCVNDAETVGQTIPLVLTRAADLKVGRDVYEKTRTTPVGHWIAVPYSAANFTATGGMTWAVVAGAVLVNQYSLNGKVAIWSMYLNNTAVGGPVGQHLLLTMPPGVTSASSAFASPLALCLDAGTVPAAAGPFVGVFDATRLRISKVTGANWTAGTSSFAFTMVIPLP